jgi:hypothetical protein
MAVRMEAATAITFLEPRRALMRQCWACRQLIFVRAAAQARSTSAVLSPGDPFAQTSGAALAGALVVARTDTRPDEMGVRREPAAHVDADLGDDDLCAEILDVEITYSTATRKGARLASTCRSILAIVASRASMCWRW